MLRNWFRLRSSLAILSMFAAVSAAPAVELKTAPVAPGPVPCPSKGEGFVRFPGSASCVRVSGRVTAGMDLRAGHAAAVAPLAAGRIAIDNRADTDLGEVRTYLRFGNGHR